MILGINHIGIAVLNIEESLKIFKKIFEFDNLHIETVESQKVRIASFNVGNVLIELTEPTAEDSPIMKFIQKKGEGIHHIAFEVDTLANELTRLRDNNIILVNQNPVEGANNMLISFIHPKSTSGVLIELCQKNNVMFNNNKH